MSTPQGPRSRAGGKDKANVSSTPPAAAAKVMEGPTGKERVVGGLFASLAIGGVVFAAIGGAQERAGLSMGVVALFILGPVAYGGLVFSFKQVLAFFNIVGEAQEAGESDKATASSGRRADAGKKEKKSSGSSSSAKVTAPQAKVEEKAAASKSSDASKVEGEAQAKQATAAAAKKDDDYEPTAYDLIMETWESLPTAVGLKDKLIDLATKTPDAARGVVPAFVNLWTWLTRARWKPFPWVYLPDPIAFAWGVLEVLFIAPILGLEIIITVPAMELLKAEWRQKRFAYYRERIVELVRSVSQPLGRLMMRDPRNHSYLPWMAVGGIMTPILFFWAMNRHSKYGLEFTTLVIYHLMRVGPRLQLFAHIHTLTHKEGHAHKGFFQGPWRFLNCTTEWWIGPFYGVVPWNYYIAHMKIHHRWHNDVDDVHTNLDLQRTNPLSFFLYVPRFTMYWTGVSPLALFIKRGEFALIAKLLYGMVAYYGVAVLLLWWSPTFALVYWLFPHMEACVLLCAISYLWHAFVEQADPGNQYVNSVTILNGHDNVWNEDYHVVHHHAPNTHWTDAPKHFEANREHYASVTATIFRDTEEGKLLQWLFEQNWDAMAEHFVDLNDKMTHEEKRELIVRRLSVVCGAEGRDGKRKEWAATSSIREFEE